ncbi:hypothetical protein [Thermoanaerobacterium sp. R66]|uniref:hypothetical protein n=1 Tax=Thermoanaerobacterium sp. R66 TaxID=2742479 RepID=UPI002380385C
MSPDVEPVLEPVTFWARGERSIGGVIPLVIFTNCDYIELQYGSKTKIDKIFPKKDEYKGIPYPPVIIDYSIIKPEEVGSWGMKWEDLYLRGFYKNNVVIEKKYSTEPVPTELCVMPDDFLLDASQKDATRIVVKILDQYGNLLPFINEVIKIEIEGPAKLQGPNEVALIGGAIAFWVETINESGVINIKVRSRSLGEKNVMVKVE